MLKVAALVLAAASAAQTPTTKNPSAETPAAETPALVSSVPWWEKVTVTLTGDGKAQSCKYETSLRVAADNACDVSDDAKGVAASSDSSDGSASSKEELTRITFERRFQPGVAAPVNANLNPGDTLLGQQVMALSIDQHGAVKGCKIVAKAGDMTPRYGCDEAQTEKFEASGAKTAAAEPRLGFMTVLVYGHEEHVA